MGDYSIEARIFTGLYVMVSYYIGMWWIHPKNNKDYFWNDEEFKRVWKELEMVSKEGKWRKVGMFMSIINGLIKIIIRLSYFSWTFIVVPFIFVFILDMIGIQYNPTKIHSIFDFITTFSIGIYGFIYLFGKQVTKCDYALKVTKLSLFNDIHFPSTLL